MDVQNPNLDYTRPKCSYKTWPIDDDIVISGIAGRFPESDNMDELTANLLNNVDMVTRDDRRWPIGLNDNQTSRSGKLKNLQYFDNTYFCTLPILSDVMEPGSRIILETTYEAIVDAGISPQEIRGTKTGVYVGINTVANAEAIPQDDFCDVRGKDAAFWVYGTSKALLANRISFLFDFTGPSTVMDTACSASLVALANAVQDLRTGNCDMAVVATSNICLAPYSSYIFHALGLLSSDGKCKVFDKNADGFVRSETVGSVFLMRRSMAKRVYATILHAKTNTDGFKTIGLFAPFWLRQRNLMIETYQEAGIGPEDIDYFESHGTGTNVGDPQESKAVSEAYCQDRKNKLLVGAVKSNLGHTEGASGICSIAKAIIIFENKIIPANLHYSEPKTEIESLHKTIEPVVTNLPFEGQIIGVNSFGVGGVNAHALLKINDKEVSNELFDIAHPIPRLVNICGRTEEAMENIFDFIQNNPDKVHRDFLALLNDAMKTQPIKGSANFPYRGYMLIEKKDGFEREYNYTKTIEATGQVQPLWLIFTGMGSQWTGMGKQMMQIDTFARSIQACAKVLQPYQVDLMRLIFTENESIWMESTVNSFVAITAMQIALFDVFQELSLPISGIIGHSFGEIACAYADGCLSVEQAMLTSYWRGKAVEETSHILPKGLMAAVGLTVEETKARCPEGVYVACHNGYDSVTVSGLYEPMLKFIEQLQSENIFVRNVAGGKFPYHSIQMETTGKNLLEKLKTVIVEPKKRSSKWISTSVANEDLDDKNAMFASGEYFVNNLQKAVLFEEGMSKIPKKSCCIEMAPHSLFNSIFKRCYKELNYISLMNKNEADNVKYLLSSIGQIYTNGFNPAIENLYPKVEWPVARGTQSISSLIKWDHSHEHEIKLYPEHHNFSTASNYTIKISIVDSDWRFLKDHCIDGRVVFPATGYLMIVWRAMATKQGQPWYKVRIEFENIRIFRPTLMNETTSAKFMVQIIDKTGEFVLHESNNLVCTGKVFIPETPDQFLTMQHEIGDQAELSVKPDELLLNNKEIYKELRIRGYDYGHLFQGLVEASGNGNQGLVQWTGHWISFVDSALHLSLLSLPIRTLFVPVGLDSFKCDPFLLFDAINKAKTSEEENKIKEDQSQLKTEFCYFRNIVKNNDMITQDDVNDMVKQDDTIPFEIMNFTFETEQMKTEKKVMFDVKFDWSNQLLITKGIEVKGLIPINIPRKVDNQDLQLEHYRFIPFKEKNCFVDESDFKLDDYIQQCTGLLARILEKYSITTSLDSCQFNATKMEQFLTYKNKPLWYLNTFKEILDSEDIETKDDLIQLLREKSCDFEKDILKNGIVSNENFSRPLLELIAENHQHTPVVKVLEICPSQHLLVENVESILKANVIHKFELSYTATRHADSRIPSDVANLKTVEWNLEDAQFLDSLVNEFDLIIWRLNNATEKLWRNGENINKLMQFVKQNGFIICIHHSKYTEFEKTLESLLENEYKAKTTLSAVSGFNQYVEGHLLADQQFYWIASRDDCSHGTKMSLYRKATLALQNKSYFQSENIHSVYLDKANQQDTWFEQLKKCIKDAESREGNLDERIWLVSDYANSGLLGFANCMRLEMPYGNCIRVLFVSHAHVISAQDRKVLTTFDLSSSLVQEIVSKDLAFNVFCGEWGSYRFTALAEEEQTVLTEHAYLSQVQRGDLSSLQWFDSEHKYFTCLSPEQLKDCKELLCNVYYSALNFKDVVLASGKIVPGPESALFDCILGLEFSGRRADTGERIMGMVPFKGIATTILSHRDFVWSVPDEWSLEDAATVPVIYITAYYALVIRGQLRKGESVLIHSGAGGVGQAAINICQHLECDIFVTVGTDDKREFIRTKFGIEDDHICNSRDITFERQIKTLTKGRGVDVVLNSLSGDKLQASLRCLAANGRFLEIGKYDMQMNSALGMFAFLKNITFHGIGLDCFFREGFNSKHLRMFIEEVTQLIRDGIEKGVVKPIERTVFEKDQAEKAFRYMTSGKHIGKVLIRIRDEESPMVKALLTPKPVPVKAIGRTWFNPFKVYIVAGGLGGVGLELVYWMVLRGARKFVLTSRSGIKSAYQRVFLKRFDIIEDFCSDYKITFHVSTKNIASEEQCRDLVEEALTFGEIGGVFNLTLVLEDGRFENQTFDKFQKVCAPKLDGLLYLDHVLREKQLNVDHFVTFSSFSAGRGNAGQTNYGYANSAMERIVEQRINDGLNGIAVQFGPINDVGVVAEHVMDSDENNEDSMKLLMGISMQRINSCLEVLDRLLPLRRGIYSSYVKYVHNSNKGGTDDEVIRQLCLHLNIDKRPEDECLGDIGLDSMAAVEIQQRLERDFNISLSLADVRKITVKELKNFRDGNRHNLKQYSDDIKKARANLSRIRFVIPSTECTALNTIQEGKPIYCLPPMKGIFDVISMLAKKINRPLIGLNWTRHVSTFTTLKEVVNYYFELLLKLDCGSPDGTYDMMVTSYGAMLVAMMCKSKRMSKQLKIRRLAVIDLMPVSMENMTDQKMLSDNTVTLIFDYIRLYVPERICDQSMKEVLELNCEKARIEKITELLHKCMGSSLQGADMSEIISNTYDRAQMMLLYQHKLRHKSKTSIRRLVIKALHINPELKMAYIKLVGKREQLHTYEKKMRAIFDLEELEEEFAERYQLHLIQGGQEEFFAKLDDNIQSILNSIMT